MQEELKEIRNNLLTVDNCRDNIIAIIEALIDREQYIDCYLLNKELNFMSDYEIFERIIDYLRDNLNRELDIYFFDYYQYPERYSIFPIFKDEEITYELVLEELYLYDDLLDLLNNKYFGILYTNNSDFLNVIKSRYTKEEIIEVLEKVNKIKIGENK